MDTFHYRSAPAHALRRWASPVALGAAIAYGDNLWLHWLHETMGADHGAYHLDHALAWLSEATLAMPLVVLAVAAALLYARRLLARAGTNAPATIATTLPPALAAVAGSAALAGGRSLSAVQGAWAGALPAEANPFLCTILGVDSKGGVISLALQVFHDGLTATPAALLIGLALTAGNALVRERRQIARRVRRMIRRAAPATRAGARIGLLAATILSAFAPALTSQVAAAPAAAIAAAPVCDATTKSRSYAVAAINATIPFNRWGDNDGNGLIYVLQQDKEAVRNWFLPLNPDPALDPAGNRRVRPRPLVLRANAGDCVEVVFTNELPSTVLGGLVVNPRVSMHVNGIAYSAKTSGGIALGFDDDSTVGLGQSTTYYWRAPNREGAHQFRDMGISAGGLGDSGSAGHGLYGAFVVEPAGSTYSDPISGNTLYTGTTTQSGDLYVDAVITAPSGPFREHIVLSQEFLALPGEMMGINYGSEAEERRDAQRCPDCIGEETSLSSWVYGDPAMVKLASGLGPWRPSWQAGGEPNPEDCGLVGVSCWTANVNHTYAHDRTKIRFGHAGGAETHVFHMHAHQWRVDPDDPNGQIIDSQTFGPGDIFTADLLFGAGSKPGTVGDSIYHCHLYPHFAGGFWALFRVHDVYEDGTTPLPDGILVNRLLPLAGNAAPGAPTADNPGYPRFIPGTFGWRAPQPPLGVSAPNGLVDNPTTVTREDLLPITRVVAGKPLDPAKVAIEQSVMSRLSGGASKPGAPFVDPCPAGAREVTYNASVIQLDTVYNEAGWHNPEGRIMVLDRDVDAVRAGLKQPEPFFIRVNAGDCINFNLTNRVPNWHGDNAFIVLGQTNMLGGHIHLVKFDVMASDGSSNGWNYQEAAYSEEQHRFNEASLAGTQVCTADPLVRPDQCRIAMPAPGVYDPFAVNALPAPKGQTIHERWFAETELRTVFTHDHHFAAAQQNNGYFGALVVEPAGVDVREPRLGTYFQPINDPAHGPVCAPGCNGEASGTFVDIIGPGAADDFREYGLAFEDFVPLFNATTQSYAAARLAANALNPPILPEPFPLADPGVVGINYRNAPFILRQQKPNPVTGVVERVDPAYTFSSTVWGDPKTPLLQAYAGDRIRVRLIQGSQEEQHLFTMHGIKWRDEPDDPNSPYVNAKPIGISEAFNIELPPMDCVTNKQCLGDYMYSATDLDDVWGGMWGIFRIYGRDIPELLPLPDNQPSRIGNVARTVTGLPPAAAANPGNPCPAGAPLRSYSVVAMETRLQYNVQGDHDPYGLIYALAADQAAIASGQKKPEPMVLRANEGDCIEVRLTNAISPTGPFATQHANLGINDGDTQLPLELVPTPAGLRVSLHPQLLKFDVLGSDGATAGFNPDQSVGPGQSILYRWYAEDVAPGELGGANLFDYGDVRGHRHHGLFAGLIVEPRNATYHHPVTGAQIQAGASADIRVPGLPDFREFTPFFQAGLNLRDATGAIIPDVVEPPLPGAPPGPPPAIDFQDQGEKGFSYATTPYRHRLGGVEPMLLTAAAPIQGSALASVFNSTLHGDPDTPVFRAYTGDPVRLRLLQGDGRRRMHSFQVGGHAWLRQNSDPNSALVGSQGGLNTGRALNLEFIAGGEMQQPGDYRYGCGMHLLHQSGGLWGLMRVYPALATGTPPRLNPLMPDNPFTPGNRPLNQLEQQAVTASVFGDANTNGVQNAGETGLAGVTVRLKDTAGVILDSRVTDAAGQVAFTVAPGIYDLEAVAGPDLAATTPSLFRLDTSAQTSATFGMVQLADATVQVYNDLNGNGARDAGEPGLNGWTVTLSGGVGPTRSVVTDAAGNALFDSLLPATYTASIVGQPGYTATTVGAISITLGANASVVRPVGYAQAAGLSVTLYNESNLVQPYTQDPGESSLGGWAVRLTAVAPTAPFTLTATTNAAGAVTFVNVPPGTYEVRETLQADWTCVAALGLPTAACTGGAVLVDIVGGASQIMTLANHNNNARITVTPFDDLNRNGVQDPGDGKLVGWTAALFAADGVTPVIPARATTNTAATGGNGQAVFYPMPPGVYVVKMAPQTGWQSTTPSSVTTANIIAGETTATNFGFQQPGTVSALVYWDADQNSQPGAAEELLANRNVRLYDEKGRTLLGTAVSDASGLASFVVSAGRIYQLEVLPPAGWLSTTTTRVQVVGPAAGGVAQVLYGQYKDVTPPPAPSMTPPGGSYSGTQSVALSSEAGTTFRYTLDGTEPTGVAGALYSGPISIAASATLKAVAIDAGGNVSPVTTALYTITRPAPVTAAPARPRSWTGSKGSTVSGTVANLIADDASYFTLAAGKVTNTSYQVDGYGTYVVPTAQRKLVGITMDYDAGASVAAGTRQLYLYNYFTKSWEQLRSEAQPAADTRVSIPLTGNPLRFMSSTGEMRFRVLASHTAAFQLRQDLLTFTLAYQP